MGASVKDEKPIKRVSLCGIICGALLCIGYFSATIDTIPLASPMFYVVLASACYLTSVLFHLLDRLVACLMAASSEEEERSSDKNYISSILSQGMRILLHWVPYFIFLFPGIIFWDTGDQLAQFFGISAFGMKPGMIFDHHPFFDTYLWGWFISVFKSLTGSYDVGIYLLGIVQCILASFTLSIMLWYMRYRKVSNRYIRFTYYFISYFPVFPIMFFCIVKDTTNIIFFLQWMLIYVEIIHSKGKVLSNKKVAILFVALTILSALTKKIMIYIIIVPLLLIAFFMISKLARTFVVCVALGTYVLLQMVFPKFLYPRIHVVQGGPQAAITVPIQQVARVAHYYPNDCTKAEKRAIDGYLLTGWDWMSKNYNPYTADPVTGFNVKNRAGTLEFLKAWASIGIRHPATYLNAFFSQESGWLSFGTTQGIAQGVKKMAFSTTPSMPVQIEILTYSKTNAETFGQLRKNIGQSKLNAIVGTVYKFLLGIPVVNLPFYVAIWTCVSPFYFIHRMKIRSEEIGEKGIRLLEALPYVLSVVTLFLYSVSMSAVNPENPARYMFPTIVLAVMSFAYVFIPAGEGVESSDGIAEGSTRGD